MKLLSDFECLQVSKYGFPYPILICLLSQVLEGGSPRVNSVYFILLHFRATGNLGTTVIIMGTG